MSVLSRLSRSDPFGLWGVSLYVTEQIVLLPMARRSPQTQAKRQREIAKAEKRREKAEKRALRKSLKANGPGDDLEGADPDVAGTDGPESQPTEDRSV